MTQRLREIVEAAEMAELEARYPDVTNFVSTPFAVAVGERVARRVADEILGVCDEGIAFQLSIKEIRADQRDFNAGIIRYLRGQIVQRFGLGDGDGE